MRNQSGGKVISPLAKLREVRQGASRNMFCMSETEKYEQVGRLAEEYSKLRGELNHVNEKLTRTQQDYQQLSNPNTFNNLRIANGALILQLAANQLSRNVDGLLGADELKHFIAERDRLNKKLAEVRERLMGLAPHLL